MSAIREIKNDRLLKMYEKMNDIKSFELKKEKKIVFFTERMIIQNKLFT